ncbi:glycosyltransferase family 4 protein [Paludibacter sp.]|uniref:glycosyltransferase family 4 protein n=1 Tax=Paludibacter sp. TaxID=1898105 RepID=UPI001354FD5F|nr:glycosyltransferase family 4 protein [Paludibacter sp.]MTK52055.1 glycosyltransferase family 4 protein [Paludibacter sp.]
MKILIVCSATNRQIAPFIQEQVDSLKKFGEMVDFFLIRQKGIMGYLQALPKLKTKIRDFKPDIIHAHYGLSGLLANLQRKIPVVTTFHGSDINDPKVLRWSKWAIRLSAHSIFVSQKIIDISNVRKQYTLLPCGIETERFFPMKKMDARQQLGWDTKASYILFAGSQDNTVKNYSLARKAVDLIGKTKLIELKGFNRNEVNLALNATDVALMTSFSEGSPQFIKEAMACNCPIVSTNVGDVKELIDDTNGCYITTFEVNSVVETLQKALNFAAKEGRTNGRSRLEATGMTDKQIATKLIEIYTHCIQNESENQQ